MTKEQNAFRILITIVSIYIIYSTYSYFFKLPTTKIHISNPIIDSITPKTGELRQIHTAKMTNAEIRARLGRSTWTLLHTMGATYPAFPTVKHKRDTLQFIYLLSSLFPCGECAGHFQKLLKENPPQVNSHDEFTQWLCKAHNIVNKRLNKPIVECKMVDEMWSCGCQAE